MAGVRPGSRWRVAAWGAAVVLVLLPLLAMQVTDAVAWTASDFAVAALLVLAVGVPAELVVRATPNRAYREAAGLALAGAFLLVWANLAVGIVGVEGSPANLSFFGVPLTALAGALLARFRPAGMARAMAATAGAQAAAALVVLLLPTASASPDRLREVAMATGFFGAFWLSSALLFRRAAREMSGAPAPRPW